ncbi:DUF6119 family protein [Candidatus Palauibacter soopunensis]|uniref:DUF6119 family protein n=1 Tax=Candidatus Palauibacter soopunensis TaxID=3056739 RepID=UPI00239A78E4|nr:DUF6119 family protein [Candidatus Palauibacter soopunensis]MDE2879585.1 TIGR04141 family sporadically distributed protein [Candidatus Palauibacter soopunensis]
MKSVTLRTFALRAGFTEPADILKDSSSCTPHEISVGGSRIGTLYIKNSRLTRPQWLDFFDEVPEIKALDLWNRSHSAVLLVETAGRRFALSFGYGYSMIEPAAITRRFGLRAALNLVDPDQIRSMDRKRLESVAMYTREQAGRGSGLNAFTIDAERELLRSITGASKDQGVGTRVSGKDAFAITGRTELSEVLESVASWYELSQRDEYKGSFLWVDNIAEERDPTKSLSLDSALEARIRDGDLEKIWLMPPEILDWADIDGFKFRNKNQPLCQELEFDIYFADRYRKQSEASIKKMKDDKVLAQSNETGAADPRWSVYDCLYAEVRLEDDLYILDESQWYRIDRGFADEVAGFQSTMVATGVSLPACESEKEGCYNARVAKESNDSLRLMDKKTVSSGRGRGTVEICDLYHPVEKIFVHVKKYSSSSTMSHLFAQGYVAAQSLLYHRDFQRRAIEKFPDGGLPEGDFDPTEYEVAYAVIAKTGQDQVQLPFFSLVNLRTAAQTLERIGFKPTLTVIPNHVST